MRLNKFRIGLVALAMALMPALLTVSVVKGATLSTASLGLSDPRPSQTSQYTLTASGFSTGQTIGCIEIDLGTNADATGSITGLSTGSSTFVSQSITSTGTWTVENTASADHKLRLTNSTPVAPQSGSQTAVWGAVTNGSVSGTGYYAKITTYNTDSCSVASDSVTVQFIYTSGQAVSMTVDGSLAFTVAGVTGDNVEAVNGETVTNGLATTSTTIPFGTITSSTNKVAAQDLTVSTNAGNGYTVYTRYTGTPSNGSATIDDHSGTNASPTAFSAAGTEAFGYTTADSTLAGTADRFTSSGGNKWAAFTTSNAELVYNSAAISNSTTRVGFQTGISVTTEPGSYTTTIVYTATPVY